MTKKTFIFDLDGVIVDTAKYHYLAWKNLAHSIGIDFSEAQNEQLKGVSRIKSLEKILTWGNKEISEERFQSLMSKKNDEYLSYISKMDASEILPDVEKTLDFLTSKHQNIALGSASKNAKPILEKVNLLNKFQVIVDGNEVTKAKPDPEVFLKGAEALNSSTKDCIVFEDSVSGVEAANRAGMTSIGIGSKNVLGHAAFVFNNFTEISEDFLNDLISN